MEMIQVGCAIIHREGKLLIAQRNLGDSFGGFWEFPGGKCKTDETLEACLMREVHEELGIGVMPERFLCRRELQFPERKIVLFFYFCKWISGEAKACDCKDFKWVNREDIKDYGFIPGDQEVLEDLAGHWEEYFKIEKTADNVNRFLE